VIRGNGTGFYWFYLFDLGIYAAVQPVLFRVKLPLNVVTSYDALYYTSNDGLTGLAPFFKSVVAPWTDLSSLIYAREKLKLGKSKEKVTKWQSKKEITKRKRKQKTEKADPALWRRGLHTGRVSLVCSDWAWPGCPEQTT
jgi:hypothetical protein